MEDWTTVSGLFECPIQEWNFEISVTYYIIVTSRIDVVPLRWMNAGLRFHMHTFDFDKQAAFKKINKKSVKQAQIPFTSPSAWNDAANLSPWVF